MSKFPHLQLGDPQPPLKKDTLRLYTMRFCPYGQRVQLVLAVKKIPYDVVYINLSKKPEWIFQKNPQGLLPTIEFPDGVCLNESLIIADYLNEEYPEPPLYPKNFRDKAKERLMIDRFSDATTALFNIFFYGVVNMENFESFLKELQKFEDELAKRNTSLFGGSHMNMVDLMMWPTMERVPIVELHGGVEFRLPQDRFRKMYAWQDAMLKKEVIKSSFIPPTTHLKYVLSRRNNRPIYDP